VSRILFWCDTFWPVIAQSTRMLMPSRVEEGFGLTVLQAGQRERPVIAARVGGLPEVVVDGETGVLIEPEDIGALARAIARLLDDPRRAAAMGGLPGSEPSLPLAGSSTWTRTTS
jgi:glycosyltransferase involved in cell wall biosynthesis